MFKIIIKIENILKINENKILIEILIIIIYLQAGMWIVDLVDFYGGGFLIYVLAIIEMIAINWIYGE